MCFDLEAASYVLLLLLYVCYYYKYATFHLILIETRNHIVPKIVPKLDKESAPKKPINVWSYFIIYGL